MENMNKNDESIATVKRWEQFLRMHKLSELINTMLKQPNHHHDELKLLIDKRYLANFSNYKISLKEHQEHIDRLEEIKGGN